MTTPVRSKGVSTRLLWMFFLASGVTGLLLEQSFERLLSSVGGGARQSGAIVLATYFVGLAAGARLFPLWRRRVTSGLRLYAFLEAGVGAYALLLGFFLTPLLDASNAMLSLAPTNGILTVTLKVAVGALWVLPPTLMMGATFPAMVEALSQRVEPTTLSSNERVRVRANAGLCAPWSRRGFGPSRRVSARPK